jgi:hypothetical protein
VGRDPDPKIQPRPGLGTVFNVQRFARPSDDGVAAGFQLTGWWDFPDGGFSLRTEHGVQKVRIEPEATSNGDVGIERHYAARPGDVFRLTARLRLASKTGRFKGRVNLAARRRDETMSQVREFNDSQEDVTAAVVERRVEATMPPGTDFVSVRVKFHTAAPGETGEGEIHSMTLERIAAPTTPPSGTRLSLYDFNVHKMQDDWRGWIEFIGGQRLRPPDIVLLQDIEHDADRLELQRALGDAFGGRWTGRGTDSGWQTSVVWRARRFTRAAHRVWEGFGGGTCVDGSQDAPAVQVKLFDTQAQRSVSLVSLKTPPEVPDECAGSNMQKVHDSFAGDWAADLCVVGTDANSPARTPEGSWSPWYQRTVTSVRAGLTAPGSLGFLDPVADVIGTDESRFEEHVTLPGKGRVDFLLLRASADEPPVVVRQMTLPRGSVDGAKWSDHRCLHAEIAY